MEELKSLSLDSLNGEPADWSLNPDADSLKSVYGESITFGKNGRDYKAEGTSTKPELKQKNDQHSAFQTGNDSTLVQYSRPGTQYKHTHSVQRCDGATSSAPSGKSLWSTPTYDTHLAVETVGSKVDLLNGAQIDAIFDMFSQITEQTDRSFLPTFVCEQLMKNIPLGIKGFGIGADNSGIRFLARKITEFYKCETMTQDDYQNYKKQLVKNILQAGVTAKAASAKRDEGGQDIATIIRLTFRYSQQSSRQARELVAWLTNDVFSVAVLEEIKPTAPEVGTLIQLRPKPGSKGSVEYQYTQTQNLISACHADTSFWAKAIQEQKTIGIPELSRELLRLKLEEEEKEQRLKEQRLKEQQLSFSVQPPELPVANPSIYYAPRKSEPQHNFHYYPQHNPHYHPQYYPQYYSTGDFGYYSNMGYQPTFPQQQPYNAQSGQQRVAAHVVPTKPIHSDDLPNCKVPVDSPILWKLSQDIREWKFLARFLDLAEEVIEEIDQYTRPNKTRDKSLKMLTEWVNTSTEATWKALGEAIQDSENTLLYEKLQELLTQYAI